LLDGWKIVDKLQTDGVFRFRAVSRDGPIYRVTAIVNDGNR